MLAPRWVVKKRSASEPELRAPEEMRRAFTAECMARKGYKLKR